jgi:Protein of unknown function (DUF3047)
MTPRSLVFAALLASLAGAALANAGIIWIGDFKNGLTGWTVQRLNKKVPATRFTATTIGGKNAVEAKAVKSMALLTRKVAVDLTQTPVLCWQWRVSGALKSADITKKSGDDQAARVYVGLKLPANSMSLGTKAKLATARAQGGASIPDGALNYVWDNKFAVGTARANVYTNRARIVVMQTGNSQAGQWVSERRDVAADVEKQFKTKQGKVTFIAISADTDNTGETVTAWFANIHMVGAGQSCQY